MKEISAADFESEVIDSTVPVLVCWGAKWCQPCLAFAPVLEAFSAEVADRVKVVKIDVDNAKELCMEYAVRSVPNLILFKDGLEVKQHYGRADRETLLKLIEV